MDTILYHLPSGEGKHRKELKDNQVKIFKGAYLTPRTIDRIIQRNTIGDSLIFSFGIRLIPSLKTSLNPKAKRSFYFQTFELKDLRLELVT